MSLRHILHNADNYPDPLAFRPERWLDTNPHLAVANKYYVPFSRGAEGVCGD